METTRRPLARIARTLAAKNDRVDTALFSIFLPLAIVGSVVPWALAASIPFGAGWVFRGFAEHRRARLASEARVLDYEERMRVTYGPNYIN